MKIVLSGKARRDLLAIYSYLVERSPKAADALIQRIDEKFVNLSHFPFMGRARSTLAPGIRSVIVGMYVIFYIVERDHIDVVRIIDGRMDIDEEFMR
jgi:toxin ParE1/3/4